MCSSFVPRGLEIASDSSDPQFKVVSLSLDRGLVGLGFDSVIEDIVRTWISFFKISPTSPAIVYERVKKCFRCCGIRSLRILMHVFNLFGAIRRF